MLTKPPDGRSSCSLLAFEVPTRPKRKKGKVSAMALETRANEESANATKDR